MVSTVLTFGGLFVALSSTSAEGEPHMTAAMFVNDNSDNPDAGWQHSLSSEAGRKLSFTVEIHNTVVGSEANDVKVAVDFPDGTQNSLNIPLYVSSSNANNASDTVVVNVTNPAAGAQIKFVPNSTRLYWDKDGDGTKEYNNTPLIDGIDGNGLTLGTQKGCNNYIIQLTFMGELVGTTPEPTPTPTPSPTTGGDTTIINNNNSQSQSQTQNNNQSQTVNVVSPTPTVAGTKIPLKTPDTGVGVLGMATLFGSAPIGYALSRYGRGRMIGKKEETVDEIASGIFETRKSKKA